MTTRPSAGGAVLLAGLLVVAFFPPITLLVLRWVPIK